MKVLDICKIIDAQIVTHNHNPNIECDFAFASDLMSDVLCLCSERVALITGLCNIQTVRTAEMADFNMIILARGKKASSDMINLANESDIVICETNYSVYKTSGLLYSKGLKAIF